MNGIVAGFSSASIVATCIPLARRAARRCGCVIWQGRRPRLVLGIAMSLGTAVCALSGIAANAIPAVSIAGICASTDLECGYVFDSVLGLGLLLTVAASLSAQDAPYMIAGAACGASFPGLLYVFSRGRWFGLGDVKLAALLGSTERSVGALEMLAIAFIAGGIASTVLLATRVKRRSDAIAFAPFLAFGAWCVALVQAR